MDSASSAAATMVDVREDMDGFGPNRLIIIVKDWICPQAISIIRELIGGSVACTHAGTVDSAKEILYFSVKRFPTFRSNSVNTAQALLLHWQKYRK
jgi:hypothetical protein